MKIAYLILATSNYNFLPNLIRSLDDGENAFFIHVNRNVDITPFKKAVNSYNNVYLIKERVATHWGGFSILEAMMNLLKYSFEASDNYDEFFFLTESDYPSYSNAKIKDILADSTIPHIGAYNITKGIDQHQLNKVRKYHFFDINIENQGVYKFYRRTLKVIMNIAFFFGLRKKSYYIDQDGNKRYIYFGTDFGVISRKESEYVLFEFQHNLQLKKYLKYAYVPSELFVSTVLMANERFKKNYTELYTTDLSQISQTHYFTSVMEQKCIKIKIMDEHDFKDIKKSNRIFFRKVKLPQSSQLLKMIDELR